MAITSFRRYPDSNVSKGSISAVLAANLPLNPRKGDTYDISVAGYFENSALVIPAGAYFSVPDQVRWNDVNWVKMEAGDNISDAAFDASWDGNVNNSPSKNAVYDEMIKKVNILDASTAGFGFVIDEDDLVSNLDTKVPTQQSVKAYADAKVSDEAYSATWDTVTGIAPSKNAVYDEMALKMNQASNLSDVANIATARTNIDVYSKAEIHTPKSWTRWTIPASVNFVQPFPPFDVILCDYLETIRFTADEPFEMMITKQAGTPDGTKLYHYGIGLENASTNTELANLLTDALTGLSSAPSGSFDSVTGAVDFVEGRSIRSQDLGDGSHEVWFTIRQAGGTDRYQIGQFTVATSTANFTLAEVTYSDLIADNGSEIFISDAALVSAAIQVDLTEIDDTAYGVGWNGVTTIAPSKNAVYDELVLKVTNPMTTAGDIIVGGVSGAPVRLGVGTEGQVLKISSGVPAYGVSDPVNDVSTQTYTIQNSDQGKTLFFTFAGAVTITAPEALADTVHVTCVPVGATTTLAFAAGSGATLNSKGGLLNLTDQYGAATLVHRGSNAWYVFGNLS